MTTHQLYIDGEWIDGTGRDVLPVENPATQELFAEVPQATHDDVERAILAARRSFDAGVWSERTPAERAEVLRAFSAALETRRAAIVDTVISEVGTPRTLAQGLQVGIPFAHLDDMINRVLPSFQFSTPMQPTFGMGIGQGVVLRDPIGVVSAITPFNYPFFVNMSKVAPAFAAGCSLVLKPSPLTPLSAIWFAEAAEEAGLPRGVLNVVTGDLEASKLLTSHPAVDLVTFTGSVPVGAEIMRQSAAGIKKVVLELGGKNADIVFDDADLARAVPYAAYGFTRNTGQGCGCISRILVQESRHDEFVERLVEFVRAYRIGDPQLPETDLGPLISEAQRSRVENYVQIGIGEGARKVYGGGRPDLDRGYFVEPTVFVDVKPSMRVAQEEIFGPVIVVIPFTDDAEAVAIANDSDFGLQGMVWSADPLRAFAAAKKMRAGQITINGGGGGLNPHSPLGGYKQSGLGREFGEAGLSEYLEVKGVSWGIAGG
jgi:aldehyde dehydrogenase (NAD+)